MPERKNDDSPPTYVCRTAHSKWQARPPNRKGAGWVDLGTYLTKSAALNAVRLYNAYKIDAPPKFILDNPKGPGFIVHLRGEGYSIRVRKIFPTEAEAALCLKRLQSKVDKHFAEILSDSP